METKTDKNKQNKGVLIITPFFSPNIGGVETHFDDLVAGLDKLNYNVFVQTYSPLTTPGTKWSFREKKGAHIQIRRYRWFGKNLFHKLEKYPLLDFFYLTPYLFFRTFIWLIINRNKVDIIHAQGFNAAVIGAVFKKIFGLKLIVSTHAVYELSRNSKIAKLSVLILKHADKVLCLSKSSYEELVYFGFNKEKLALFKYWINLVIFKPLDKIRTRKELNIENIFTVLFVGRLIEKKGVRVLVEVADMLPQIQFIFIGVGPEEAYLKNKEKKIKNIKFIGVIPNEQLCRYYNIADIFCIASQYKEGFGRVVMEAIACGLPVIGSNKGGIPEALDKSVSILIDPTSDNLKNLISALYNNNDRYSQLRQNCRKYAEKNFSENNIHLITEYYE